MKTELSADRLYDALKSKGYRSELCYVMVKYYLNTEYTANRMLRYLNCVGFPSEEELIDEMLCILSDRDRFVDKKIAQHSQEKINRFYMEQKLGLGIGIDYED